MLKKLFLHSGQYKLLHRIWKFCRHHETLHLDLQKIPPSKVPRVPHLAPRNSFGRPFVNVGHDHNPGGYQPRKTRHLTDLILDGLITVASAQKTTKIDGPTPTSQNMSTGKMSNSDFDFGCYFFSTVTFNVFFKKQTQKRLKRFGPNKIIHTKSYILPLKNQGGCCARFRHFLCWGHWQPAS